MHGLLHKIILITARSNWPALTLFHAASSYSKVGGCWPHRWIDIDSDQTMKPNERKIYLASKSPRRRELLRQIGVEFELLLDDKEVDEQVLPDEKVRNYVARVTLDKMNSAYRTMLRRQLPVRAVLAADTTVVIDDRILGKPANKTEAMAMIRSLSGRSHQVLTSVAVIYKEHTFQITQTSDVVFRAISEHDIQIYCNSAEPYDKAGAYGIQGLAAVFIQDIAGSHSGIMGLPLFETAQLLEKAGLRIL